MSRNPTELRDYFERTAAVLRETGVQCQSDILAAGDLLTETIRQGAKIMLCGNGGSAADAQHFAAELVGRMRKDLERPAIAALALTTDTSFLTAYSNDYAFEQVFSRQVEALGKPGDALVLISTSGSSANLCVAAETANERGIHTIGLLGGDGGSLRSIVGCSIVVPDYETARIQECHGAVIHALCGLVEETLYVSLADALAVTGQGGRR
jgi:D-sedoheptulose 7-phosphate isomerase